MKKIRYEYVIKNGDYITDKAVLNSREEARDELREVKSCGFKEAKILQRKYVLTEQKEIR